MTHAVRVLNDERCVVVRGHPGNISGFPKYVDMDHAAGIAHTVACLLLYE